MNASAYRKVCIGDLGRIVTGKTPPTWRPEFFGQDYPFLTPTDIDGAARFANTARWLSTQGSRYQQRLMLPAMSICVVCIGATIGKTCMTDRPSFSNQQINSVIVREEEHDPFFIYHILSTLRQELKQAAGGAATPIINKSAFSEIEVCVPPLPIQRRIAGILSAYDDLIENSQRRIKILEEMARRLYREWFVHFRFPGHEGCRLVDSPLGEIPEGWEVKKLNNITLDIVDCRGKTPTKLGGDWSDKGILALSALNVKGGRLINLEKSKRLGEELYARWMKNPLRQGDILMTSEAPLGELFFLCREERYCLSQRLFSIRADCNIISPAILYFNLDSEQSQHEIRSRASGSTVSGIRQSELRNVPVVVPSLDVQEITSPILHQLAEKIHTLDAQIQNLRRTRDLLLPRLLSGQIDVEALPEPALQESS